MSAKSGRAFALAAAKIGKQNNGALRWVLRRLRGGYGGVGALPAHSDGEPLNEPQQMIGHAFVNDVLPIAAKLVGDGRLLGTAQPHDVVASP
jgi:hypothetical protein